MALSNDLISQFAKIVKNNEKTNKESTVYGTVITDGNGNKYVKLDGSDQLTPIDSSTTNVNKDDRVSVLIKDHTATVTGNISSPSVRSDDFNDQVTEIKNFDIVIAEKVQANEGYIQKLQTDKADVGDLTAATAKITELETSKADVGELNAAKAEIDDLKTKKIDADVVNSKFATIENLNATNVKVNNLEASHGEFETLTTNKFAALDADILELDTNKLSANEADIRYANIDFSNIDKAAIEQFYAKSGIIKDLVIGESTITGELVGVTIKGDLIEGGTVIADKLVVKGEDGLYYKLNTEGGATVSEEVTAEQLQNGLSGSVIIAKTITAEKINVNDLVAFGATIGGFKINSDAIYSGVKETVDNTTNGIYLGSDGQVSIGDDGNFFRYYKDENGDYKLEISCKSISDSIENSKTDITDAYTSLLNESLSSINESINSLADSTKTNSDAIYEISNNLVLNSDFAGFVKTIEEKILDIENGTAKVSDIQEWAKFDGANLELGSSDPNNPFKCVLSTSELGFYQGSNKVAWISNNELHVLAAIITNSIGCGNFTFIDEGDLGFSLM